ncbi:MAG TPA: MFS transporter [Symbiobacteriaceae bacterium]|nr:MFS transporter [Symbiobacteriaceae bacterium]
MAEAQRQSHSRAVSTADHFWMNLFWFANNVHWVSLMSVVIPSQVAKFLGNKEQNLPMVFVWGTLVAVLVHPYAGALSDRIRSRMGRRRPFLLWGTLVNVAGLLWMATTDTLLSMTVAFIVVQFTNNFANAPFVAIIADKVPADQRGKASGWFGLMSVLGSIGGAAVAGLIVDKTAPFAVYKAQLLTVYGLLAAVQLVVVLLTVWKVKEEPAPGGPPLTWQEFKGLFWVDHRKHPDFAWVYITRFLMQQGQWAIFFYLQYFYEDVLGLPGEATVFQFNAASMVAATIAVLYAGTLSDRVGRKVLVYLAGGLMTAVAAVLVFFPLPSLVMVTGLLFGLGFGTFSSVDQALATDVLPSQDDYGRDMGIWQVASILPQITGIVIGGMTLSFFRTLPNHMGYSILLGITTLFFGLGTYFIHKVKGVR